MKNLARRRQNRYSMRKYPSLFIYVRQGTWLSAPVAIDWGADKSLARPTSRRILFDGENISFDASLVLIFIQLWL